MIGIHLSLTDSGQTQYHADGGSFSPDPKADLLYSPRLKKAMSHQLVRFFCEIT